MNLVSRKSPRSVYYGWWVVLACSAIAFLSAGIFFFGFTTLLKPVTAEFGWSLAVASLAFSLRSVESGVTAPFMGLFVDRLGPRKLILFGVVVFGLGLLALSRIGSLWAFYASFLLISIGISACTGVPSMTAVARWFSVRSSRAMGLFSAGAGAGGVLVPVLGWLIASYGWRTALLVAGIAVWAMGIPLSRVVKDRSAMSSPKAAEPTATLAENPNQDAGDPAEAPAVPNYKLGEALRMRTFWLISIALTLSGLAIFAILVHMVPFAHSVGFSVQMGALMVTVMTVCSIAGRLGLAWLGDVWDKRYVLGLAFALEVASLVVMAYVHQLGVLLLALAALGIAFGGTVSLRPTIQVDYFGLSAFGKIQGMMMAVLTVGGLVSPVFMGWVFDRMGGYRLAIEVYAGAALLAMPLILSLPRPAGRRPRPQVVSLR